MCVANHRGTSGTILLTFLVVMLAYALPAQPSSHDASYSVKPSDIDIPPGVSLGDIRRTFRPFANWTLVCDENLKARTKICNVTQNIVDQTGATVFSWSLAASEGGKPVFLLRTPSSVGAGGKVLIQLSRGPPLEVMVNGCDHAVCVATTPVGPRMRDEIRRAEPVIIEYIAGDPIRLLAPLFGLEKAVAAID